MFRNAKKCSENVPKLTNLRKYTLMIAKQPNKVKFTKTEIERFVCPDDKKEFFFWDTDTPFLGVRILYSGRKTFIVRATVNGKTRKTTLGTVDSWGTNKSSLERVREEARRIKSVAMSGIIPAEEKRQNVIKEEQDNQRRKIETTTLETTWFFYVESNKQGWSEKHYKDHFKAIQAGGLPNNLGRGKSVTKEGCLYPLKDKRLTQLTAPMIEAWINEQKKTRAGVAAHTYRLLFACLNWLSEEEHYSTLFDIHQLKTKKVRKAVPKLTPKTDVLHREQLSNWFKYVRRIQNPVIKAYVQALLITGARREELAKLTWEEVDLQWNKLVIRDKATTKGQDIGYRTIPLTPYVKQLINALPRRNQWVFSSPRGVEGRMVEHRKSYEPALISAGLKGLTLHGLRRSFSTLAEWVEAPAGVIAQIQGHKPSAVQERHYKPRELDLLRLWHERIEDWILEQAGIEKPQKSQDILSIVR